jgi:hypothetical protein
VDVDRLLRPNPFAGDRGRMSPAMREALDEPDPGRRLSGVVAAVAAGRLLVPALPHEHPGRTADGGVAEHSEEPDPTGQAVAQAATLSVRIPGGRFATPVFSSADRLLACYPDARPIPVLGRNAAAQALASTGILALDPQDPSGRGAVALGRGAVAAIAAGEEWVPPWDNPKVLDGFAEALAERGAGDADLRLQPTPDGILRLVLAIPGDAGAGEAYAIVEAVVGAAEANPYLRSHLDVVEILPVSANSQSIP